MARGALGLLLSTIGLDPIDGTKRFMFGQAFLAEGINVTCALIGLFSMSQVFILAETLVESVLMRYPDRATMCVSSQAGCAVGCRFCSTGHQGFSRNLTTGEILAQ